MNGGHENRDGILLAIERLETHFHTEAGTVRAVDGVTLTVHKGRPWASWANQAAARA